MVNKKGQEMSVSTLVLIVIGIVVLVMLILGFSMGWQNLWGKIGILGGGSGVETVVQACNIAATSDATASYCSEFKQVTLTGGIKSYVNCQYSDVDKAVTKKLTCVGDPVKEYCVALANATTSSKTLQAVKDTNVNGALCSMHTLPTKCAALDGTLTLGKVCPEDKTIAPGASDVVTDTNVCCK